MKLLVLFVILIANIIFLVRTAKKNKITGGFIGIYFSIIFFYLVIPILLILTENDFKSGVGIKYGYDTLVTYFYNTIDQNFYFTIFLIVLSIIFFNLGYKVKFTISNEKNKINQEKYSLTENNKRNLNFIISMIALITFVIGLITIFVFTILVGGVGNALALAETTRGFETSVADINYIAGISKLLSRIITVSAVFYLYLALEKKTLFNKIMSLISFILSIYYYLLNAGRMPLLTFIVIYIYIHLKNRYKKGWGTVLVLGVFSLPIIDILSNIFLFFQSGEWREVEIDFLNYIRQLSSNILELLNIREIVDIYGYQFFKYIPTDILNLLPGISFQDSYVIPSEYFNGEQWRLIGGIPNDIISYGYLQLGIIGISITMFTIGKLMYYIDDAIIKIRNKNFQLVLSTALATQVFQIVSSADLGPILKTNYLLWFIVLVVILYYNISKTNKILKLI